ncbi:DUF2510 domain-containing protein [Nocardioides marmorisolisilvae]|uniref:DUF2510 domain-containing protein n=1 Tax=Nocardioides marmorisolisilvae TaxID=1542737 RepID=A0A3N0DU54_9ACTN|nr:DUF2510 domain-containing protein [Nocardioides marmorisolisilvae]RNL79159.1 DUF2510 domain-containing protein [Nocardioides marmorisolisilvae]
MTTAPAGWHPDPRAPGQERYWNGAEWTEQVRPAAPAPPPVAAVRRAAWYRHAGLVGPMALVVGIGIGVAIGAAAASGGDDSSKTPIGSLAEKTPESTPTEDTDTPEPEPAADPSPDGSYQSGCDYLLDPYKFTADASIENTGNITTVYELDAVWYLAGGQSIKASKRVTIQPGRSRRVGIEKPATVGQIDAHQSYTAGDEDCKAVVKIIDTVGEAQAD